MSSVGTSPAPERTSRRGLGAILVLCVAVSLLAIFYPAWVIQPFRAQGARELSVALVFVRYSPIVTLIAAICGLLAAIVLWPRGRAKRVGAVLALVLLLAGAGVARIDYFELMFHPNPNPRFVAIAQAAVDADDMVMVVRSGAEAHAYPIRFMAYHHLVNDSVAGTPVVPTY